MTTRGSCGSCGGGSGLGVKHTYFYMDLHGGPDADPETWFYHVRNRFHHAELGRWTARDPLGYIDGMSLYEYASSSPQCVLDPMGWQKKCCFKDKKKLQIGNPQIYLQSLLKAVRLPGAKEPILAHGGVAVVIFFEADFKHEPDEKGHGCCCECCGFQLYVRGHMKQRIVFTLKGQDAEGNVKQKDTGWLNVDKTAAGTKFVKDKYNKDGPLHKAILHNGNCFLGRYEKEGKKWKAVRGLHDAPGFYELGKFWAERSYIASVDAASADIFFEFKGEVIDVCNKNKVLQSKEYSVKIEGTIKSDPKQNDVKFDVKGIPKVQLVRPAQEKK